MESLPTITIPDAASLADSRTPAGPTEKEQCISRCAISAHRLEAWFATGSGDRFDTYHPAAFQQMFSDKYKAELEKAGYVLSFEGDQLVLTKK